MRHVIPAGETTHKEGADCWCRPTASAGLCVHTPAAIAADRRRAAKQLTEIDASVMAHAKAIETLVTADRQRISDAVNALRSRGLLGVLRPLPPDVTAWGRGVVLLVAEEMRLPRGGA